MRLLMSLALLALMVLAIYNIRKVYRWHRDENWKSILNIMIAVVIACVQQILVLYSSCEIFSRLVIGIYTCCLYWMLYSMVVFIQKYTGVFEEVSAVRRSFFIFGIIESILLVYNVVEPLYFETEPVQLWGMTIYKMVDRKTLYDLHLVACVALAFFIIYPLAMRTLCAPGKFARKKFVFLFALMGLSILAAGFSGWMKFPIDIGVYFYIMAANAVYYLSYVYVPHLIREHARSIIVTESKAAFFIYDHEKVRIYTNQSGEELEKQEAIVPELEKYLNNVMEADKTELRYHEVELPVAGENRIYNVIARTLMAGREKIGYSVEFDDVTDEIRKMRRSLYQMTHDELTGIYNNVYFCDHVEKELKAYPDTEYVLVTSDIYGFKFYNELFGRQMGDKVLKYEASLLKKLGGSHAVYGRLSDDELAILVRKKDFREELFKKCIQQMREEFSNSQYKIYMNAGVYEITDRTEPVSTMCDKAKLAIEQIKNDYSVMLAYYTQEMLESTIHKRWILDEAEAALSKNQFAMFLQPQVDTKSGKWLGAEALIRWIHPEKGMISPGEFIPVLEEAAMVTKVDRFIWEAAAKKLAEWKKRGREDLYISVNVSGHDFYRLDLYEEFTSLVRQYDILPGNLRIEITETVLAQSKEQKNDTLSRLRADGFVIEIDDFGSGYSSLNSLKDMEMDVIKIDMGFLGKTDHQERSKIILRDIVHMIQNLQMGIIVEGVETKEQLDFVTKMGCDRIQGYYYSRPIPVADYENQLAVEMS